MEIVKFEASPDLTPREMVVVESQKHPMIKDVKKDDITKAIGAACAKAYAIKGFNIDEAKESDAAFLVSYVTDTLKSSFSTYRIPEVCQAIELGARGELFKENDLGIISAENIFKWIFRYNDLIRKEALAKQRRHQEKQAAILEESHKEEKIKTFEAQILGSYKGFLKGYKNGNSGVLASYYRHLDKKELITMSIDRKKEIMQVAELTHELAGSLGIKSMLQFTVKEFAEAMALKEVFEQWGQVKLDLNEWI